MIISWFFHLKSTYPRSRLLHPREDIRSIQCIYPQAGFVKRESIKEILLDLYRVNIWEILSNAETIFDSSRILITAALSSHFGSEFDFTKNLKLQIFLFTITFHGKHPIHISGRQNRIAKRTNHRQNIKFMSDDQEKEDIIWTSQMGSIVGLSQ